ncbi:MAG: hypothetical protein WC711_04200 [Candidatus Staskawiczbacteria bacterium]|jgi:hypothetical protein
MDDDAKVEQKVAEVVEEKKEDVNPIEEAKKILEETKKTLGQITDERKRIEKATAEMLINGRSYAGQSPPKPAEETPKEYADKVLRGEIKAK